MVHINEDYATLYQGSDTTQIYPKALHVSALLHYNFLSGVASWVAAEWIPEAQRHCVNDNKL